MSSGFSFQFHSNPSTTQDTPSFVVRLEFFLSEGNVITKTKQHDGHGLLKNLLAR